MSEIKDKMQNNMDFADKYGALTLLKIMIDSIKTDMGPASKAPGYELLMEWLIDLYGQKNAELMLDFGEVFKNNLAKLRESLDEDK